MHVLRPSAGHDLDCVGIEAQLKHVSGLGLNARQLGVDWLVGNVTRTANNSDQKVGDPSDALMDERHLVDDFVVTGERIADTVDPIRESLVSVPFWDAKNPEPARLVFSQTIG